MGKIYRTRIFRRLFLAIFAVALVGFLALYLFVFFDSLGAIRNQELALASSYGDQATEQLLSWFREREDDVAYLAADLDMDLGRGGRLEDSTGRLLLLGGMNRDFRDLFVADPAGRIVASTNPTVTARGLSVQDRDYFRAALQGGLSTKGLFTERFKGESAIAVGHGLTPVGTRLPSPGVVVGLIPLGSLRACLASYASLGAAGRVLLFDDRGRVIASSEALWSGKASGAEVVGFGRGAQGYGTQGSGLYRTEGGRQVFGAWRWQTVLGLGLCFELDAARAMAVYRGILEAIGVVAFLMLGALGLTTWVIFVRLMEPLGAISDAAEAMGEDRYSGPLRVHTGTEFDRIAETFDRMALSIRQREETLRESAARDSLTGLYNHGRLREFLDLELRRNRRANGMVSFVMIDLDRFKDINDTYGHPAGDAVLRGLADILTASIREGDLVGRYGGDEFAVILAASPPEVTRAFCERIRGLVEARVFPGVPEGIRLTVSLGWTTARALSSEAGDIVAEADRALYEAKAEGRNAVRGRLR